MLKKSVSKPTGEAHHFFLFELFSDTLHSSYILLISRICAATIYVNIKIYIWVYGHKHKYKFHPDQSFWIKDSFSFVFFLLLSTSSDLNIIINNGIINCWCISIAYLLVTWYCIYTILTMYTYILEVSWIQPYVFLFYGWFWKVLLNDSVQDISIETECQGYRCAISSTYLEKHCFKKPFLCPWAF